MYTGGCINLDTMKNQWNRLYLNSCVTNAASEQRDLSYYTCTMLITLLTIIMHVHVHIKGMMILHQKLKKANFQVHCTLTIKPSFYFRPSYPHYLMLLTIFMILRMNYGVR